MRTPHQDPDDRAVRLRAALQSNLTRGRGGGYALAVRAEVTDYARQQLAHGDRVGAIARRLGLTATTLGKWLQTPTTSSFVPAVITPDVPTRPIVLVSPAGWRAAVDLATLRQLVMVDP